MKEEILAELRRSRNAIDKAIAFMTEGKKPRRSITQQIKDNIEAGTWSKPDYLKKKKLG
jgi:hypothetical protein